MRKIFLGLAFLLLLGFASAIPLHLSYQGKIFGSNVSDVNRTIPMSFCIYDAATAGNCYWNVVNKLVDVNVTDVDNNIGVFSILLGDVSAGDPVLDINRNFDLNYFGITIQGNSEASPRIKIGSAAYAYIALNAENAETLDGNSSLFYTNWDNFQNTPQYGGGLFIDMNADLNFNLNDTTFSTIWGAVDGNVGTIWPVIDGNMATLPAIIDGNVGAIYGNVWPAIDGNIQADTWMTVAVWDENFHRANELDFNAEAYFNTQFKTAFDANVSASNSDWNTTKGVKAAGFFGLGTGLTGILWNTLIGVPNVLFGVVADANVADDITINNTSDINTTKGIKAAGFFGSGAGLTDVTASGDGWITQAVLDSNLSVSRSLIYVSIDANMATLPAIIDGNVSAVYGNVWPAIDGNIQADTWMTVAVWDENFHRANSADFNAQAYFHSNYKTAFDANISASDSDWNTSKGVKASGFFGSGAGLTDVIGVGDGWMTAAVWDENFHRVYEADGNRVQTWTTPLSFTANTASLNRYMSTPEDIDLNIQDFFHQKFKTAFDANVSASNSDWNTTKGVKAAGFFGLGTGLTGILWNTLIGVPNVLFGVVADANVADDITINNTSDINTTKGIKAAGFFGSGAGLTDVTASGDGWATQAVQDANWIYGYENLGGDANKHDALSTAFQSIDANMATLPAIIDANFADMNISVMEAAVVVSDANIDLVPDGNINIPAGTKLCFTLDCKAYMWWNTAGGYLEIKGN